MVLASIIIIVPSCVLIGIILYTLTGIKIVKQKVIDRNQKINERFDGCNKFLNSIRYEIIEHPNEIDLQNLESQKETIKQQLESLN